MSKYDKPLEIHCEGCDSPRLDVKRYLVRYHGHLRIGEAHYCGDCAALAHADWSGTIAEVRLAPVAPPPDPDIRPGGKHAGDPWCDPSAR